MIYKVRADILRNNIKIGTLKVKTGNIKYDSKALVKRAAKLTVSPNFEMHKIQKKVYDKRIFPSITLFPGNTTFTGQLKYTENKHIFNMFSDRLRIIYELQNKEYVLGTFLIVSSPKKIHDQYEEYELELYDESVNIKQFTLDSRLFFSQGTNYLAAIESILTSIGFKEIMKDDSDYTFNSDREFKIGESGLDIINNLLDELNYNHLFLDEFGTVFLTRKVASTIPEFIYKNDKFGIIKPQISQNTDIYNIPNVFVGVVSNTESTPLMYKKENKDPASKTSIINRGFKITKVYELNDIASYEELKKYIDNIYIETIATTEIISISTKIEANHKFQSIIQIDTPKIQGIFKEISWDMNLNDFSMKHNLERKIYE